MPSDANSAEALSTTDATAGLTCTALGPYRGTVAGMRQLWCARDLPGFTVLAPFSCRAAPLCRMQPEPVLEIRREQAHLSAEQPPSRQDPRFSAAHADPRRPGDHRAPAYQGPLRAVRLIRFAVMLPEPARLRRRADFAEVVRGGTRAGRPTLVVHLLRDGDTRPRAGFIVSKQVGTSVRRHRVTRQLRHLMAERLDALPVGTRVVVRARPESAGRTATELGADLDRALDRLIGGGR